MWGCSVGERDSPPREEGTLRHQENFGEAHLSAADGVVAHESRFGVSDDFFLMAAPYRACAGSARRPLSRPPLLTRRGIRFPTISPSSQSSRSGNPRAAAHLFILKSVRRTIQLPNIHAAWLR